MTQKAVVVAERITKTLGQGAGEVQALRGVSLHIYGGEMTLLMGPSGSGKTTLLSIFGCLLTPTSGQLEVAGHATDELGPEKLAELRRHHVGFIFQSYNLFPTLTALENTCLALDVRGVPLEESKKRARRALEAVDLTHRSNAYPSEMSGGEQQRVAVARALIGEPSIILADEPTSALDGKNGRAVMELLAKIARSGDKAVLAVTHDPRTEPFSDRIVYIEDGRITGETRSGQDEVEKVDDDERNMASTAPQAALQSYTGEPVSAAKGRR